MSTITDAATRDPSGPDHAGRPIVAALGDDNRHDLGVGPTVLRHLRGRGLNVTFVDSDAGDPAQVEVSRGTDPVIVVDPIRAEPCHPGRVHRLVMSRPDGAGSLIVFAVETGDVADGAGLSPAVAGAPRRVADAIAAEIGSAQSPGPDIATRRSLLRGNDRS
ncbi:hypothetical protein GCM10009558_066310 [Virgisporangium aurantiacum]